MHIIGAIAFCRIALRRAMAIITQMGFHAMLSGAWPEGCATQLVNPLNAFSLSCGHAVPPARNGRLSRDWSRRGSHSAFAARLPAPPRRTHRARADTGHAQPTGMVRPGRPPAGPAGRLVTKLKWTYVCTPFRWRGRGCASLSPPRRGGRPDAPRPRSRGPARPVLPVRPPSPARRDRPASLEGRTCPERPIYAFQPDAAPLPPRHAVVTDPFNARPARPQCTCTAQFTYHGVDGVIR